MKRILNCIPSVNTEKDFTYENAIAAGFIAEDVIPQSTDLREDWWKINDQGSTGSCVGWAAADSLLRWHFVKKNKISPEEMLSIRFIWMSSKETDVFNDRPTTFIEEAGTSLKAALDIARHYGCVTDSILPFNNCQYYGSSEAMFYSLASRLKILNYINLSGMNKINAWKKWIGLGNGPILTRLDVDSTWDNATSAKGMLDVYDSNSTRGGHAVAIVGYTKDRFIIRNSWGNKWGDKGFAYASYDYAIEAFTESYGINL